MCKMISSESIIGNFLLAALEKGDDRINVDKLFMFESLLGSNLNHLNYFTCLNYYQTNSADILKWDYQRS